MDCFERSRIAGHITGSAWVVNSSYTHVLMTHHAKLEKWLQLGGHADGDSNIKNVATKELKEESGLTKIELLSSSIFDLDIHTIPERKVEKEHEHFDIRYRCVAEMSEPLHLNHESKELAWIPLGKLDELTKGNRSIIRMSEKTSHIKGKVPLLW